LAGQRQEAFNRSEHRSRIQEPVRFKWPATRNLSVPGRASLYLGDVFRLLQLSLGELLEAWERDRLGLFELVKSDVERGLGEVVSVRLQGAFLDPSTMMTVAEYVVELAGGF